MPQPLALLALPPGEVIHSMELVKALSATTLFASRFVCWCFARLGAG